MNMTYFTVEEENLICAFGTGDRVTVINEIKSAVPNLDEPELIEIAQNTLRKLEAMTDTEFDALVFHPAYQLDDEDNEPEV